MTEETNKQETEPMGRPPINDAPMSGAERQRRRRHRLRSEPWNDPRSLAWSVVAAVRGLRADEAATISDDALAAIIARASEAAGVDPDLVRAIMYVEAADGHYLKGGWLADKLEWSDTIEPMNVHREVWDGMAGVPASRFDDPEENIKVGAEILKRIEARLDKKDRTVEKIATIYNSTGRERVSGYGARVARAYRERPWEKDR